MWGNTTTSRNGTMGSVSITSFFSLSRPNISPYTSPNRPGRAVPTVPSAPENSAWWCFRKSGLTDLLDEGDRLFPVEDHVARHHALLHLLHRGEVVHEVEHQVLDDHAQSACADFPLNREIGD